MSSIAPDRAGVPSDAVDRIRTAQRLRAEAETARIRTETQALRDHFLAEKLTLIPADVDRRLRERAAANRLPEGASQEERRRLRAAQLDHAVELGVDLAAMDRMRADFGRRAKAIRARNVPGEVEVIALPDREIPAVAPLSTAWDGSWDQGSQAWSSRGSQFAIHNAQSYFDPQSGRAGSHIRFRQRQTGDDDSAGMSWTNGYMVLYTPPRTAQLLIDIYLTCAFSRHFIDTDNEPGNSGCHVSVNQNVVAEIYRSWSHPAPEEHVYPAELADDDTIDLEEWIDHSPIGPGATRKVTLRTDTVFQAGSTIAVYVGLLNEANADYLNDTRVTAGVDAAWHFFSIEPRPL